MRPSGFRGRSHASITEIELVVMMKFLPDLVGELDVKVPKLVLFGYRISRR